MENRSDNNFKWSLFGVSVLLGAMLTIQITSGKNKDTAFNADIITVKSSLAYEIEHQEQLKSQIYKMQSKIQEYKDSSGNQQQVLEKMKEELNRAKVEAGLTPVEGNGIKIVIRESPVFSPLTPDSKAPHPDKYHIWDYELVYLINILQSNGAQAISFNGERIVTTTGIREVGVSMDAEGQIVTPGFMQVNFNAVTMPYEISAIGDIEKMKGAISSYIGKEFFIAKGKELVITEFKDGNKLKLPAFTGTLNFRFATEDKAEGAAKP